MIETKTEKISPESEQECISTMADFGWTLQSSQEITKENYVKLVFQRDTAMPNYARVSELERKYFALLGKRPDAPAAFNLALWGILFFFVFPLAFLYSFLHIRGKKKYQAAYDEWNATMVREAAPMRTEAAGLVG